MSDQPFQPVTDNIFLFRDTCNVYVIRTGDSAVLIDFGCGDVLSKLPLLGIQRVTDVLMTHHHHDQGQGLACARAAGACVWVPATEYDLFARIDAHRQARAIYNSYDVRQDRFSLLTSVAVSGTLDDYATRSFGGHPFYILPTPGHTLGSISLLAHIDGKAVAFTGDLIAGPGKIWSLAAT